MPTKKTALCEYVKSNNYNPDPDSSYETWNDLYRKIYIDVWGNIFDFNKLQYTTGNITRIYAREKKECNLLPDGFEMSGDTVFNFKKNYYDKFQESMTPEQSAQFIYCRNMHHSLLNFSFMSRSGAFQQAKGKHNDRLDIFLYYINQYYINQYYNMDRHIENEKDKILYLAKLRNNTPNTRAFLDFCGKKYVKDVYIEDEPANRIYNYCNKIYFISPELIDKLLSSGEKTLQKKLDLSGLTEYVDLAVQYWKERAALIAK